MVPIIEPEVLMDGSHDIEKCYQVTTNVLNECYNELEIHKINLKGTVLKPNMIVPGSECKRKSNSAEIAKKKTEDLNANDLEEASKIIAGSARSMGIEVKD